MPDPDPASNDTPPGPPTPQPDELAGLDEHARRLVERANSEAAAFRHELREAKETARQAIERLGAVERSHESEQDRAVREAEERGRSAAQAEIDELRAGYERQLAISAIKARAAGRFADPDDAVRLLALDELLAEPDQQRRDQQVEKALTDLLEAKPYLARETRRPLVTPGGRSEPPNGRPRERSWLRG